jgi:hypothetical protein
MTIDQETLETLCVISACLLTFIGGAAISFAILVMICDFFRRPLRARLSSQNLAHVFQATSGRKTSECYGRGAAEMLSSSVAMPIKPDVLEQIHDLHRISTDRHEEIEIEAQEIVQPRLGDGRVIATNEQADRLALAIRLLVTRYVIKTREEERRMANCFVATVAENATKRM